MIVYLVRDRFLGAYIPSALEVTRFLFKRRVVPYSTCQPGTAEDPRRDVIRKVDLSSTNFNLWDFAVPIDDIIDMTSRYQ